MTRFWFNLSIALSLVGGALALFGKASPSFVIENRDAVLVAIVATLGILYAGQSGWRRFWAWRAGRHHFLSSKEERRRSRLDKGERVGIYLSPIKTNLVLRPVLSILAGQVVGWSLYVFAVLVGSTLFPAWAALALGGLLAIFFAQNDKKAANKSDDKDTGTLVVPKVHVAILTFLGRRFPIYLEEGSHYWYGGKIGFSRSTDPIPNPQSKGEMDGFVFIGRRQIEIYARTQSKDKGLILKNVAGDFTEISTKLTVVIETKDPIAYANSTDPILDAAERSRSALRTIVSYFVGVDNAVMKSVFSQLMGGHKLLTAFIKEPAGTRPRGSVIQNHSGAPIFEVVPPEITPGELDTRKANLRQRIANEGDPSMIRTLPTDAQGILIQERGVVEHLLDVMYVIGAHFVHASVSDITLSEEVTRQANVAGGEAFQRTAQLLSARTVKEVREIIGEGADRPGADFATMVALARDGHAQIIYVPGADALTRAAVAGANQIGR